MIVNLKLAVALDDEASVGKVEAFSDSIAANCEENSVERVRLLSLSILPSDSDRTILALA